MHFMNPVPVMKLVELIRGMQTSDEVGFHCSQVFVLPFAGLCCKSAAAFVSLTSSCKLHHAHTQYLLLCHLETKGPACGMIT